MKLPRPYIPLDVRLRVAMRQLGTLPDVIEREIHEAKGPGGWGKLLDLRLGQLAELLGCCLEDLQLDHDPALCNRRQVKRLGAFVNYDPPANDPAHLIYRTDIDHYIKTRVRGDGALLSDLALRRKFKRIAKRQAAGKR